MTLDGGTKSCRKARGKEEKLKEDGGMNGMKDLPPPRISYAEETVSS